MSDLQRLVLAVLNDPPPRVLKRLDPRGDRTQEELAEMLGVSQPTVSCWLAGKQDMSRGSRYLALAQLGLHLTPNGWIKLN
jgi:hypothetical protein